MDTVQALQQVFIFKDVPRRLLEIVARAAEEVSVSPGETLFSPGDRPNALFIIRSGTLRVTPEGEKSPSILFGTGETIGEMALLDGGTAAATVTALERVDLFALRGGKLGTALASHPEAGYELYRAIASSLARRLRRAVGVIVKEREGG
jgi:CRP/FNR family cyclic AMP-dependent transcriptional regulator